MAGSSPSAPIRISGACLGLHDTPIESDRQKADVLSHTKVGRERRR
jgi:hypothetical protein